MCTILLTGERGSGKSTIIKKFLDFFLKESIPLLGFLTRIEKKSHNERLLIFKTIGIIKTELIVAKGDNTSMSPEPGGFDKAAELLRQFKIEGNTLVIDEIGYLESECINFQQEVFRLISSSEFAIVGLRKMRTPFLDKIKNIAVSELIDVTPENRDNIFERIIEKYWKNYILNQ
ncbi:MAG TPA: nucleoside-triphosphatase [Candidatus Eremiobacteraeota bacterium]|nr:MAG: Nucleoside-triphosphatase THEP1 [bacterium ADurb.Bin363]HPZ10087.1 nucleoside-triphosphatase [Candidatus Eremiobacteraeota bacterium]